jgi:hypothetical protein
VSDLVVIVPSRGRPQAVNELAEAFAQTCAADTDLVFALDSSDERQPEYVDAIRELPGLAFWQHTADNHSMVEALNRTAVSVASGGLKPFAVGFLGDDHRPRTRGWDQAYLDALRKMGTGIVYGDDGFQHQRIPTQCAMTADIVRTLGYMAPPTLTHMYVDNAWLALGRAIRGIQYLPDVFVEHLHPVAGKAEWDEGYARVNAKEMYQRDQIAFNRWMAESLPAEAARLRRVMA